MPAPLATGGRDGGVAGGNVLPLRRQQPPAWMATDGSASAKRTPAVRQPSPCKLRSVAVSFRMGVYCVAASGEACPCQVYCNI